MKKNQVRPTKQQQVPGTEGDASKQLRELHQELAVEKYQVDEGQKRIQELNREIAELMVDEEVEGLACEIEVGDEVRRFVTTRKTTTKLKSKFQKQKPPKQEQGEEQ